MDLSTNLHGKAMDMNISKSMPLMDQNSNNSRLLELYKSTSNNPSLCRLQNMAYDDKSSLGIHTLKDSLKTLTNDKAHLQSVSSSDSKTLSPSSCQSNWESSHLHQEILSSPTSDQQNVKSSNGSGAPYKELTWREKDRRRRFREEWKHTWMVVPHGNYEVLCLICQKIMTQRKLDTIKRHTVRRHSEILAMDESAKCHYFEQLIAKYGLTNSTDSEEHSVCDPVGKLNSDSIDESSTNEPKDLSYEEKNENFEHVNKQSPPIDDEPSAKKKKIIDSVFTNSSNVRSLTTQSNCRSSSNSNCHLANLGCSIPSNSLSPPYPPSGATTFRPHVIIPPVSSSPSGKSQSGNRASLTSFERSLQSPSAAPSALPNSFNLQYYSYMYSDILRRPYLSGHLPPPPQTFPPNMSQLGGPLTSPNSLSENPFWCPPSLNFHSSLHKTGFIPPILTQPADNMKSVNGCSVPNKGSPYPIHDAQSTSHSNTDNKHVSHRSNKCLSSTSSPESNHDAFGILNVHSPVLSKSVDTPLLVTKPRKGSNGYHHAGRDTSKCKAPMRVKIEEPSIEKSPDNKTQLNSPDLSSPQHCGPLLCEVLRYHKDEDILQCVSKLLLSKNPNDEVFILSCSGELSKATLSYRCRSDTSSVVSKAVTHEGPLEILSMCCSVSKYDVVGEKIRWTISLTDSNGCVIGGRVGGPLIVGNDGVEILLGRLKYGGASSTAPLCETERNSPLLPYSPNDKLHKSYKSQKFRVGLRSKGRMVGNERCLPTNCVNNGAIRRRRTRINSIRKSMEKDSVLNEHSN